ncbi:MULTISPECIES: GNAT family N-acetyltransferase [unclassified Legionella]|uniref:GNAT family N-acetyltransferase n=1 Tax=unclassified Legionella TaxID=2622702 RepID=UPI0010565A13|nr:MULTISPECIES: GNAT family N-acetyltransferase [unclassified Legionella]MDI9818486.1 GNAT family N-acetyltransferase [Legionella sp. PL877]
MINITIQPFNQLDNTTLYALLALRSEVFIVEQQCVFQDLDYKDQQAEHLLVHEDNKLVAYARILPYDTQAMSFGRLATAPSHRNRGLGKQIMAHLLSHLQTHYPQQVICITAQTYLQDFYRSYGFTIKGEPFELDGIPHILMTKTP